MNPTRLNLAAIALVCAAPLAAQQQADFRWEKQLSADKTVSLHNLNGRITVMPSTSGKVEIVGTRHGSRHVEDVTIEVYESDRGISVCSMFKTADMECDDDGLRMHNSGWNRRGSRDWDEASIDMEVKVPKGMRVTANNVSGNVKIVAMEGVVRASSVSGDVRMESLRASSVRASSVSGDVSVDVDNLTGDGMLTFSSVSGNVTAQLPKNLDADVSMHSVSGSLDSDFPLTLNGRVSRNRINARIGKGGRELEVHTVSGDVRLKMAKQ